MRVKIKSNQTKVLFFMILTVVALVFGKNSVSAAQSSGFFEYYTEKNGTIETAVITKYNGLESHVIIPDKINGFKVTEIKYSAFQRNEDITKVTLPKSVKIIGNWAFADCKNLESINLEKVEIIGESAFSRTAVKSIKFTAVKEINRSAFAECEALEKVDFGKHEVESIGSDAFKGSALKKVNLNCKYLLGSGEFAQCKRLETVIIKSRKISPNMFRDCTALKEVKLDDSITEIEAGAFQGCTALSRIELPKNLTYLGSDAGNGVFVFKNCTALEEIEIPGGVNTLYLDTFLGCTSLKKVTLNEGLWAIDQSGYKNNAQDISDWNMVIPNTVRSVDLGTATCSDLIIPNSVMDVKPLTTRGTTNGWVFSYYKDSPLAENLSKYENLIALEPVPATSLKLNKEKLTLQAGTYEKPSTYKLKAIMSPANTTDAITWTSTNANVAEVDTVGNVTAKSAGMVVIRATSTTGLKADFTLTVEKGPSQITMDTYNVTVGKGETFTRKAMVDEGAYDKTIIYESSNPKIATVDKNGMVKTRKVGTVTIKAVASNGLSKAYTLTVKKAPKKVLLSIYSTTLIVNEKVSLAAVLPEGTASTYLTYTSSNEKIATIDKYGMITPKQEGTVTITVKAFNGSKGQKTLKVVKKR